MPTFTTIALESLLEPRIRDSYKNTFNSKQITSKPVLVAVDDDGENKKERKKHQTPNHVYIKPALYITPPPAPIPECASESLSPSPYVVNHKRRGREAVILRIDRFEINEQTVEDGGEIDLKNGEEENGGELRAEELVVDEFLGAEVNDGFEVDDKSFEPRRDSSSIGNSCEVSDLGKQIGSSSFVSNQGEFFDVNEEFSSDGSISSAHSYGRRIDSDLRATRVSLLEEIERRKTAEDALSVMYTQWQRIANLMSQSGITFPMLENPTSGMQPDANLLEQFTQEVIVARFVAEATGKGQARAEAELAAEAILESKDQEISRLRDRLQYHEAVNHEMCQRNQGIKEVARRQRQRKKSQRRWLWSFLGLSVAIGASVVAFQTNKHHPLLDSGDSSDTSSCISSSESA